MDSMNWAAAEFGGAELGDLRRLDRLVKIASKIVDSPEGSLSSMMGGEAENKAAQRFFANDDFEAEDIIWSPQSNTLNKIKENSRVLLIQDTCHLNFDTHKSTIGLGHIGSTSDKSFQGLMMHWSLALDGQGECLGLANLKLWARDPDPRKKGRNLHQKKPIEEKESYKWIEAVDELSELIPLTTQSIWVTDREGDIYEHMDVLLKKKHDFVIRCNNNRAISDEENLLKDRVRSAKVLGTQMLKLSKPIDGLNEIEVNIRASDIALLAPPRRGGSKSYLDCSDQDIYAIHISPTDPTFEFEWILLTSLTVETFDEALEIIWIYKQRWHIECVHKTLKSGFRAEQLTLNHRDKLSKAIAIFLPCAVHVYWMAHKCRHQPEASADTILTKTECLLLSLKNKESKEYIPTIKEAWLWISLMGGFRGSKNSAPPGQIVFWRGLRKLKDMAIGASLIVESLK